MGEFDVHAFASVWDAIEETPEQAAALRLRSDLLHGIATSIERWGGTRVQVEARLGITSTRLDDLLQGRIDLLSLDDLVGLASRAGITIWIESVPAAA